MRAARACVSWLAGVAVLGCVLTASAGALAIHFPGAIYPLPVAARAGGALADCPNQSGLERWDAAARKAAILLAGSYYRSSLIVELENSDRAAWSQVRGMRRRGVAPAADTNLVVAGSGLGSHIAYADIVRRSCGEALVAKSFAVGVRQPHRRCEACGSSVFFVRRGGRALVYWLW